MKAEFEEVLQRIEDWKQAGRYRGSTIALAGSRVFIRLQLPWYWSITPKEFPTSFINGKQKEDLIDCIGYGATLEEALAEAFTRLPG